MNTMKTKKYLDENNVVPMKADMTRRVPAIEQLLEELGHPTKAIPYIAIFPGDGSPPITYAGILTQAKILELLADAAKNEDGSAAEQDESMASDKSGAKSPNALNLATD